MMELSLADLARALAFLPPDPQTWTRQQTTQALQAISQARAEKYSRIMRPRQQVDLNTFIAETNLPIPYFSDTDIDRRERNRHPCLVGRQAEEQRK